MKRQHATVVFILGAYTVSGQPILTGSVVPVAGVVFESFTQIEPLLNQGNSGPNQVWDLSSLQASQPGQVFEYVDPSSTPYSAQFPESNIAASTVDFNGLPSYSFFYGDNTVFTQWGNASQNFSHYLDDGIDYLRFPFTYLDHFTDHYHGTSDTDTLSGFLEFTADAYGTLILPSGTFTNCLRVLEARKDTTISNGTITFQSNDTIYHYYVPGYQESLCQVVYHHALIEGSPFDYKGINWRNEAPIGISETGNSIGLHVYPNPAREYLIIDGIDIAENFAVSNSIGQKFNIAPAVEEKHFKLDVTLLPPGLYTINVSMQKQNLTSKFLVNR